MSYNNLRRPSKTHPMFASIAPERFMQQRCRTPQADFDESSVTLSVPIYGVRQARCKLSRQKGLGFQLSASKVSFVERKTKSLSKCSNVPPQKALDEATFAIASPLLSLPAFFSSFASPAAAPTPPYRVGVRSTINIQSSCATSSLYSSRAFWLFLYLAFNLGITLLNKHVLVQCPFPYTITAMHASFGSAGGYLLQYLGYYKRANLGIRQTLVLVVFSFVFTLNIAASNTSLYLVTIPFHQIVRATTPIFTLMFSRIFMSTPIQLSKALSLLPIIAGVALATSGDFSFTSWGFCLTLLGAILAALKGVLTSVLQSTSSVTYSQSKASPKMTQQEPDPRPYDLLKLGLHPLDLLSRLSILALIQCLVYSRLSGEMNILSARYGDYLTLDKCFALGLNGLLAFGINIVSFYANKRAGPLNMSVAANIKQVLTILLAVSLFDVTLTPINALGICLSLVGGGWYSYVEYTEKTNRS